MQGSGSLFVVWVLAFLVVATGGLLGSVLIAGFGVLSAVLALVGVAAGRRADGRDGRSDRPVDRD